MPDKPKCNQPLCEQLPIYRFTWPGKAEEVICEWHARKLHEVAGAMGVHVQLIPLGVNRSSQEAV